MTKFYDIHCHVFNENVLIRKLVNIVQTLLMLEDLIEEKVEAEEMKCRIEGILTTLEEVTKPTSEEVFKYLNEKYDSKLTVVPLMFDLAYVDDNYGNPNQNKHYKRKIARTLVIINTIIPLLKGRLNKKYPEIEWGDLLSKLHKNIKELIKNIKNGTPGQLEIFDNANYENQIEELEAMVDKHANIKPFFSIDPRRQRDGKIPALDTIKDKILSENAKFSGVKLYAPAGFSPTDPILFGSNKEVGLYELCEKYNIPITVHNSNSGFACFSRCLKVNGIINKDGSVVQVNEAIRFKNEFIGIKILRSKEKRLTTGEAIKERATMLNHPKLWRLVLERYPKLTINFAHLGGSGQIMQYINYDISGVTENKYKKETKSISDQEKEILKSSLVANRNKMKFIEGISTEQRAQAWNILYKIGLIDNWAKAIFDLVSDTKYSNAYTDLSCFSSRDFEEATADREAYFSIKRNLGNFKSKFFDKLSAYEKSKFMYGSDFFLAQFFGPTIDNYIKDFKEVFKDDFEIIASDNPKRFLNGLVKLK